MTRGRKHGTRTQSQAQPQAQAHNGQPHGNDSVGQGYGYGYGHGYYAGWRGNSFDSAAYRDYDRPRFSDASEDRDYYYGRESGNEAYAGGSGLGYGANEGYGGRSQRFREYESDGYHVGLSRGENDMEVDLRGVDSDAREHRQADRRYEPRNHHHHHHRPLSHSDVPRTLDRRPSSSPPRRGYHSSLRRERESNREAEYHWDPPLPEPNLSKWTRPPRSPERSTAMGERDTGSNRRASPTRVSDRDRDREHGEPRSRSSTPQPPPSAPSAAYLAQSLLPSIELPRIADTDTDPSSPDSTSAPPAVAPRKLLLLDLNGTLLLRSPHKRPGHPRTAHPRPYMRAFRAYLFHDATTAWLDSMVWSSAQPHSVRDMVHVAFGRDAEKLVGVWARDTLGLGKADYNRKMQTTKDLNTPWGRLAAAFSPTSQSPPSSRNPSPSRRTGPPSSSQPHPHNHPPSSSQRPTFQTQTPDFTTTRPAFALPGSIDASGRSETPPVPHSAATTLLVDDSPLKARLQPYNHICISEYVAALRAADIDALSREKTRARERAGAGFGVGSGGTESDVDGGRTGLSPSAALVREGSEGVGGEWLDGDGGGEGFDDTLLAVIGIMDAVKAQSNVAGWVRAGGLWAGFDPPVVPLPASSPTSPFGEDQSAGEGMAGAREGTGNDASSTTDALASSSDTPPRTTAAAASASTSTSIPEGDADAPSAPMWFDHPGARTYWAARGRRALRALGIVAEHGIER